MRKQTMTMGGLLVAAALLMQSSASYAIPAWGRLFDEKCSTCHYPQPPQLNNFGYVFQRLGYRMLDIDDNDNLIARAAEDQSIGNQLSLIVDARASDSNAAGSAWTADLHEVELVAGGSLGTNDEFAYIAELVLDEDGGGTSLEDTRVQWTGGTPDALFTVKAGQFSPVLWRKLNGGRITTTRPLLINSRVPAVTDAIGTRSLVRLRERQQGVEFGYALNKNVDGQLSSWFLTGTITKGLVNGRTQKAGDNNSSKDYTLQAMYLYGDHNTVSLLYWTGKDAALSTGGGSTLVSDDYNRWAILGNHAFGEEGNINFLYGVQKTSDDIVDAAGTASLDGTSYFGEIDYTFQPAAEGVNPMTVLFRYDWFKNENVTFPANTVTEPTAKMWTLGLAGQYGDNLLWSLEYNKMQNGGPRTITAEAKLVF